MTTFFCQVAPALIIDINKITAVKSFESEKTPGVIASVEIYMTDGKFYILYGDRAQRFWEFIYGMIGDPE